MLVVLGIVLLVGGAIVSFGIDAALEGVDLYAIGMIMIAGGVISLAAAAIKGASFMSMSNRKTRSERHVSPDGQHVVEESEIR